MDGPPQGVICTPDEYQRSLQDPSIHCLTRAESIGLTVSELLACILHFLTLFGMQQIGTEAGMLSLLAILYVVFLIVVRYNYYDKINDPEHFAAECDLEVQTYENRQAASLSPINGPTYGTRSYYVLRSMTRNSPLYKTLYSSPSFLLIHFKRLEELST